MEFSVRYFRTVRSFRIVAVGLSHKKRPSHPTRPWCFGGGGMRPERLIGKGLFDPYLRPWPLPYAKSPGDASQLFHVDILNWVRTGLFVTWNENCRSS